MSGFDPTWLALRASFDSAARSQVLERRLAAWAAERPSLDVVDLGSGTGANLRHLAPLLPPSQRWRLVENDPALIGVGRGLLPPGVDATYEERDLARDLEGALLPPVDLVTASALIDLVSAAWLDRLVAQMTATRAALLVVLSHDGRIRLDPAHDDDPLVERLVAAHQRTDKGFGPALGGAASAWLAARLEGCGGELHRAPSDWRYGPADRALHAALVLGWAEAATAMAPELAGRIADWREARLADEIGGLVGHEDLLWLP